MVHRQSSTASRQGGFSTIADIRDEKALNSREKQELDKKTRLHKKALNEERRTLNQNLVAARHTANVQQSKLGKALKQLEKVETDFQRLSQKREKEEARIELQMQKLMDEKKELDHEMDIKMGDLEAQQRNLVEQQLAVQQELDVRLEEVGAIEAQIAGKEDELAQMEDISAPGQGSGGARGTSPQGHRSTSPPRSPKSPSAKSRQRGPGSPTSRQRGAPPAAAGNSVVMAPGSYTYVSTPNSGSRPITYPMTSSQPTIALPSGSVRVAASAASVTSGTPTGATVMAMPNGYPQLSAGKPNIQVAPPVYVNSTPTGSNFSAMNSSFMSKTMGSSYMATPLGSSFTAPPGQGVAFGAPQPLMR